MLQCDNKTAVESFVFLLRPQADLPNLDGCFTYYSPHRKKPYRHFDYTVIRVWELDPEEILRNGGIGLLPLTAISSITLPEIPQLIRTLHKHWNPAKIGAVALDLWTAFDILLGLRCTKDQVEELMKGITSMEESTTYQAIFHKGELQGVEKGVEKGRVETREILFQATLNAAAQKFQSKPPSPVAKRLKSLEDPSEYVQLIQNLEHAKNWEEWLPPKHSRKRGS